MDGFLATEIKRRKITSPTSQNEACENSDSHESERKQRESLQAEQSKQSIQTEQSQPTWPDHIVNEKLKEFSAYTPEDSAQVKTEKLHLLLRSERKKAQYRQVVEKEQQIQSDPAAKTIRLDWIADMANHREDMAILLRMLIKDILREWESDSVSQDLVHETKRDMVKLLYRLRSGKLSTDMLTSLATVFYYLEQEDYQHANESYLKLSIGSVAWPIGVMNVGMHARSADAKITGLTNAANIMANDSTRRWMTGIKRMISYKETARK